MEPILVRGTLFIRFYRGLKMSEVEDNGWHVDTSFGEWHTVKIYLTDLEDLETACAWTVNPNDPAKTVYAVADPEDHDQVGCAGWLLERSDRLFGFDADTMGLVLTIPGVWDAYEELQRYRQLEGEISVNIEKVRGEVAPVADRVVVVCTELLVGHPVTLVGGVEPDTSAMEGARHGENVFLFWLP